MIKRFGIILGIKLNEKSFGVHLKTKVDIYWYQNSRGIILVITVLEYLGWTAECPPWTAMCLRVNTQTLDIQKKIYTIIPFVT